MHEQPTPAVALTAHQSVEIARAVTAYLWAREEGEINWYEDPPVLRVDHDRLTPYVELVRQLVEGAGVTQIDMLREVATDLREQALAACAEGHEALNRLRVGDPEYVYPGRTVDESVEMTKAELDGCLEELAVANGVLAALGEPRNV